VVNEAMACGLPAIVSDAVGCAPDLIEEGSTGFTFPLGDVAALTKRFLDRPSLPAESLSEALARKLGVYSVATCTQNTLSAVSKIIGAAPGRAEAVTVR
jgi:glycosyltransferase involved in cell wall biosynthesis